MISARIAVLVCLLSLAGCASTTGGEPRPAGSSIVVTGTVLASPGCPGPQRIDVPCPDKPVAGAQVQLVRDTMTAATATTDPTGRFRVVVTTGGYHVTA